MHHNDFTIIIGEQQTHGYPLSAVAEGIGRVSGVAPLLESGIQGQFQQIAVMPSGAGGYEAFRTAGESLFRWLVNDSLASHLRVAWDRATQVGRGLRLRLSIDAPEIAALPWELLYDPERDCFFATGTGTPIVRYLDQTVYFGGLATQEVSLPLHLLLITPNTPDLNLAHERAMIEEAVAPLGDAIRLHILDGVVTSTRLSDILLAGQFSMAHFSGHGGFSEGRGLIALNGPNGELEWLDDRALAALLSNHTSLRLAVLNACSSGQADERRAFRGLAMQLVRQGIPAAVAMQYPLTDEAAITFAREFYRQLCAGENAGLADVATAHARNILSVRYPCDRSFAAPVLYTHAADGVIFTLPQTGASEASPELGDSSRWERVGLLISSLKASTESSEDWDHANLAQLAGWRQVLEQAQLSYLRHLSSEDPDVRQAAHHGLVMVQARLRALEAAIARAKPAYGYSSIAVG